MAENPRKRNHKKEETLEVVCRIKKSYEPHACVVAQDEEHVRLIPPNTLNRNNAIQVEKVYRFGHVFDCDDSQKEVFNRCAVDLIEDLVKGKNSLLFAYGVTSSGKTFTMTGENNDMNGSCQELLMSFSTVFLTDEERGKLPFYDNEIFNRAKDFKSSDLRTNMSKKLSRTETIDEIIGQYKRAQERRKIAKTLLNASSSRSHSVFNIRLVMAPGVEPYDIFEKVQPVADESKIIISQMSMVDWPVQSEPNAPTTTGTGCSRLERSIIVYSVFEDVLNYYVKTNAVEYLVPA
uniref:Kinesin motor domain-containing protein n=1 Tax=Ditylenchus dipsaci TaxID=166011 RepID=A0A915E9B2_9BILA